MVEVVDDRAGRGAVAGHHAPALNSLTGLRFLAAATVFVFHLSLLFGGELRRIADPLVRQGSVGVSFFFILSGFVLTWSMRTSDSSARFYFRRFARIYPLYALTWVLAISLSLYAGFPRASGRITALGLVLGQAWIPHQDIFFALNVAAWSLSAEAFFYLLFPLYAGRLARASPRTQRVILGLACALVFLVAAVTAAHVSYPELHGEARWGTAQWLLYICPAVRMLEFVAGCCLALQVRNGLRLKGFSRWIAASAVAYLAAGVWLTTYSRVAITLIPFCCLLVAAASRDLDGTGTLFSRRWAVKLGQASFAFYLVHDQFRHAVMYHTSPITDPWIAAGVAVALLVSSLTIAWALHTRVEQPVNRWLIRRVLHRSERGHP